MIRYVGLDVHKKFIQVCMLDAQGGKVREERVLTEHAALQGFAQRLTAEDQVAMEACSFAWNLYDLLEPYAGGITVCNAYQTRAIAQAKIKTDKVDARTLADLLRCGYLPAVWVPDATARRVRSLVSYRHRLVHRLISVKNQIQSLFTRHFLQCPHSDLFGKQGRQWMAAQRGLLWDYEQVQLEGLLSLLGQIEQQRTEVETTLAGLAWRNEEARLLMTIPGVDYPVALAVLAAIGDITRFECPQKLCAYLGLVPSVHQSGNRQWYGRITKRGNVGARWMLVQAAHQLTRLCTPLRPFYERLRAKKGRSVAIVAVARKLATLVWHLLTHREPYRYANARAVDKKFSRLSIRVTGKRRKSGPPAGQGTQQKKRDTVHLSGGNTFPRTLAEVHAEWGLPPCGPLPPGEERFVQSQGGSQQWLEIH